MALDPVPGPSSSWVPSPASWLPHCDIMSYPSPCLLLFSNTEMIDSLLLGAAEDRRKYM